MHLVHVARRLLRLIGRVLGLYAALLILGVHLALGGGQRALRKLLLLLLVRELRCRLALRQLHRGGLRGLVLEAEHRWLELSLGICVALRLVSLRQKLRIYRVPLDAEDLPLCGDRGGLLEGSTLRGGLLRGIGLVLGLFVEQALDELDVVVAVREDFEELQFIDVRVLLQQLVCILLIELKLIVDAEVRLVERGPQLSDGVRELALAEAEGQIRLLLHLDGERALAAGDHFESGLA